MKDSIRDNNISVCTAGKLREEIRDSCVKFDQFTLMVFDECHHAAQKGDVYARLMERFLEYKENNPFSDLPQIIGMTASPGAGDNYYAIRTKSIDHLVRLAAWMNATGGYHFVPNQLQKNHSCKRKIVEPRDTCNDPFIDCIVNEMVELEALVPAAKNHFPRWSQAYGTRVQQLKESFEVLKDETLRDAISTLDLLGCYYYALQVYMDLQQDAIKEVENYLGFPENDKATQCELTIKGRRKFLLEQLKEMNIKPNPLLDEMMETLYETFRTRPNSRALVFVPSKKHAYCVRDLLHSKHSAVHELVTPDVITGQVNQGMTQVEQEGVLLKFRTGKVNVLVATSVAQEGLDIPECNLVIRYQHVSNEIAQIQAEGRARAENSKGITILSSESKKKMREFRNGELVILVNDILENTSLPVGSDLEKEIQKIQMDIVIKRHERIALKERLRHSQTSDTIKLYCKRCKEFACNGSDIYLEGPHHVVPVPEFRKKITWKEHKKPQEIIFGSVSKTHKVHCAKCGQDWGVGCKWKKTGHAFPVIKCVAFAFEKDGVREAISKWNSAHFTMKPLSDWLIADDSGSEDEP